MPLLTNYGNRILAEFLKVEVLDFNRNSWGLFRVLGHVDVGMDA